MTSKEKCSLNPGDCAHSVQQHVWMEGGSNEADLEPIMKKKLTKDGENRRVPRQYLRSFGACWATRPEKACIAMH